MEMDFNNDYFTKCNNNKKRQQGNNKPTKIFITSSLTNFNNKYIVAAAVPITISSRHIHQFNECNTKSSTIQQQKIIYILLYFFYTITIWIWMNLLLSTIESAAATITTLNLQNNPLNDTHNNNNNNNNNNNSLNFHYYFINNQKKFHLQHENHQNNNISKYNENFIKNNSHTKNQLTQNKFKYKIVLKYNQYERKKLSSPTTTTTTTINNNQIINNYRHVIKKRMLKNNINNNSDKIKRRQINSYDDDAVNGNETTSTTNFPITINYTSSELSSSSFVSPTPTIIDHIEKKPNSTTLSSYQTKISKYKNQQSVINGAYQQQQSLNRYQINNVFENALSTTISTTSQSNSKITTNINNQNNNQNNNGNVNINKGKVSVLGLFELSTRNGIRPEGHSELAAAQMAVRHINDRGLLPGYTLELLTNDTKCDPGVGVDRFFHALYTQHSTRMIMLLGSACSEVTESLAKVVPYWNIVQVSFGSTSPALSDRREFPLFYRTVAPDSSHNPARIAFIRRFGWDTVTTFSQNEEIHSLAVNDLVTELESANISCAATITFAKTDFKDQLKMLRDLDTRIIIGSFSHDLAPKIFCEVYKLGMYGADYAWILHETVGPYWWLQSTIECTRTQLIEVSENLLVVSSHNSIVGSDISYSGLTNNMFIDELLSLNVPQPLSRYAPQTYDAVWAIALALRGAEDRWRNESITASNNNSLKLDGFDYTRFDMASEFLKQFSKLKFLGISGPVSFSGADRIGTSVFYQIQNGYLKPIALYYPSDLHLDFSCPNCVRIKWKSGQVPIAKRIFKLRAVTVLPIAFYTITALAFLGIALSIGFLAFNLHFRKLKAIKLSSPKLSNIIAVGCILVYAAVILLGFDYSTLPSTTNEHVFSAICSARVYLLSAGFSLAFGSMFAKTYRVHRIFTHHGGGGVCKDKMLRDTQLISLVCALLLLDGLVVTLWVVTDPMEKHLSNLTLEISLIDRSVVYQPQVEVCRSQHTQSWLGALYAYKGLLLIVGLYMAWETRHVKISALNDSQYIGVSVYSVVITSAIVVVLGNLIAERVTLAYITITALILTSTTSTLCLLFLPKMNDVWSNVSGITHDPVIHSMGLKLECNTRRFVTDDRRELQYRVEVQNRVYKKEVAELEAEIEKLEKLLLVNSTSSLSNLSVTNIHHYQHHSTKQNNNASSRTPSITGGLPLLLLSVLPPVIPRASWPSADHMTGQMRKSVTFSSQPRLDDSIDGDADGVDDDHCIIDDGIISRIPAIDLLNLRLTHQQVTNAAGTRVSLLKRIKGMFGSRPPSRKASTTSVSGIGLANNNNIQTENNGGGIATALRAHMGFFSNLVPLANNNNNNNSNSITTAASCNAINIISNSQKLGKKSSQMAKSGTAINIITISDDMDNSHCSISNNNINNSNYNTNLLPKRHRKFSTAFTITGNSVQLPSTTYNQQSNCCDVVNINNDEIYKSKSRSHSELKVNFQLPTMEQSQNNNNNTGTLTCPTVDLHQLQVTTVKPRIKGSPRFPHRIILTNSLNALQQNNNDDDGNVLENKNQSIKWKSMEESTFSSITCSNNKQKHQHIENQQYENELQQSNKKEYNKIINNQDSNNNE